MATDELPVTPEEAAAPFSEAIRSEAGRSLFRGPQGYRRFQELIAPHITAEQSRRANVVVHKAIVVVMWGLAAMLTLRVVAWPIFHQLAPHPMLFFTAFNDLESALILFGAVLLSRRFPGTYGSAYLFPVNALGLFFGMLPGDDISDEVICAALVWGIILAYALIGLLFDYSIHLLQRRGNGVATLYLAISLFLYVAVIVWDKRFPSYSAVQTVDPNFIPWSSLPFAAAVGCIQAWAARGKRGDAPETKEESLCRWALMRWQIYVVGIVLAMTLCIFPFIGFLSFMGLHNRVMEGPLAETLIFQDQPNLRLYWYEKGDFMTEKDFTHGDFYYLNDKFWDVSEQNPVRELLFQLKDHPDDEELYERIDSSLKNMGYLVDVERVKADGGPEYGEDVYRLVNENQAAPGNASEAGESDRARLLENATLLLPRIASPNENAPPEAPSPAKRPPHYRLLPTPFDVEPIDYGSLRVRLENSYSYQITLIFLGIFGWLILWRRGGDSWPARMAGVWLIALFASLPCNFGEYFVSALSYQCSLLALQPSGYAMSIALRMLIAVLDATGILIYVFAVLGLPMAWLWTYYCWPSRRTPGWRQKLDFFGNFVLVWVLCLVLILVPALFALLHPENLAIAITARAISAPILIFGLVIAGVFMRRRHAGDDLPALGTWPVVAFIFLELVMLTSWCFDTPLEYPLPGLVESLPLFPLLALVTSLGLLIWFALKAYSRRSIFRAPRVEKWAVSILTLIVAVGLISEVTVPLGKMPYLDINLAVVVGVLAVFTTFLTLLRADFLNLQAVDDLSYLLVIFAVPALMALFEAALDRTLSRVPLLSEDGIVVIGVILAVSLYPRLHHILGHLCQRFSAPRLHEIEESIEEAIENLVDLGADSEKQDRLRHLFAQMEIESYALYVRRAENSFGHFISHWPQPPGELVLSESLQRYLRGRSTFTDFFSVPNLWASFFHQFEMRRIENLFSKSSGVDEPPLPCRYLLPICIGKTVCALLILPASIGEMNHQPFAGILNSLGVAALTHKEAGNGA